MADLLFKSFTFQIIQGNTFEIAKLSCQLKRNADSQTIYMQLSHKLRYIRVFDIQRLVFFFSIFYIQKPNNYSLLFPIFIVNYWRLPLTIDLLLFGIWKTTDLLADTLFSSFSLKVLLQLLADWCKRTQEHSNCIPVGHNCHFQFQTRLSLSRSLPLSSLPRDGTSEYKAATANLVTSDCTLETINVS